MMKKSFIWVLIALMATSLVGIIIIQTRWIKWSISLNEEKFNKEVASALNHVEEELASNENTLDLDLLRGDFTAGMTPQTKLEYYYRKGRVGDSTKISNDLSGLLHKNQPSFRRQLSLLEGIEVNELLRSKDLGERIDIKKLSSSLRKHLVRRDINTDYHYGVYANRSEAFIILDDNYVVEEQGSQYTDTPINKGLLASAYSINLFETENEIPGVLYINFPSRNRLVFKDVWLTIVGSIVFTGIILFCFSYTIHVIFKQKKISEMRTDFINNMTHEFKTPIATINLAADSITSPMVAAEPSKVSRFANIIKQENGRMLNQVEKVLQMALLEKKDYKLRITSVDLHDTIIRAVENANLQAEQKGGHVHTKLSAQNPVIMADQTHISNIINNLLDNANKYSPEAPDIRVVTENFGGGVEISVEDKGIGMTKDQRKHIFDKFYRVHTGNLHDVKGFGLGLSYVKAMVLAHGGTIDVQSETGSGSRFILKLPFGNGHQNTDNGVS